MTVSFPPGIKAVVPLDLRTNNGKITCTYLYLLPILINAFPWCIIFNPRGPDFVGSIPVTTEFFLISCDSNQVPKWFGTHAIVWRARYNISKMVL